MLHIYIYSTNSNSAASTSSGFMVLCSVLASKFHWRECLWW